MLKNLTKLLGRERPVCFVCRRKVPFREVGKNELTLDHGEGVMKTHPLCGRCADVMDKDAQE